MLIVHDTESIDDETAHVMFSQSQTEMMHGRPISTNQSDDMEPMRRRSCGAAEIGVILSPCGSLGHQAQGTAHHFDDITAEVDEREEYSHDFESEGDGDHPNEALSNLEHRSENNENGVEEGIHANTSPGRKESLAATQPI